MDKIEKIRAEIERRIEIYSRYEEKLSRVIELKSILSFIDSLPDENTLEPYNPVYDEAYLNEKIAKASKTWVGVDVDKYMDEVRGREPDKSLEEAANNYALIWNDGSKWKDGGKYKGFIAGANWQKDQMMKDIKLAYGKVSMNPFDCQEAFEELIKKYDEDD